LFRFNFNFDTLLKKVIIKQNLNIDYNVKTNWLEIEQHNRDTNRNFTKGINQFSDLTPEEFNNKILGGIRVERKLVGHYGFTYII
jgi:hypothetical protein